MARHKNAPYRVESHHGKARLDFDTTEGQRVRVPLGIPYAGATRATPRERSEAFKAAEAEYRRLTAGRVVEPDPVIKSTVTLQEAYELYLERFLPAETDSENQRRRKQATLITRRSYGNKLVEWANDEARRPDGARRWREDSRTPLQRILSEGAPEEYLGWRLTHAKRKTVRKDKSNLTHFLQWLKVSGLVSRVPVVVMPVGAGTTAQRSGKGIDIYLTALEAARIVSCMPEWSDRTRQWSGGDKYLVRPFFEFMFHTGLRPSTIQRLTAGPGGSWHSGNPGVLIIKNEDDKAGYGRALPLSKAAQAVLVKYSPAAGKSGPMPIFGHHDFRKYIRPAAAKVLPPERAALFGSYHIRHFYGTFIASRTTNIAAGMFLMGHTQPSTFAQYVHPRVEEAAELVAEVQGELAATARAAGSVSDPNSAPILPQPDRKNSRGEWIRTTDPQTPSDRNHLKSARLRSMAKVLKREKTRRKAT